MLIQRTDSGFSLVELLVAITIAAVLMALAMPSMSAYFQNAKLGGAARGYQAGIQTARTEAIKRNMPVEFLLTDSALTPTAAPSASGKSWMVRFTDTTQSPATVQVVDGKSSAEGAALASGSTSPIVVSPDASPDFTGSISFDGMGATTPSGSQVSLKISNPSGGACAPSGPMRCLEVKVLPGGQIMVCDPLAVRPDSRAC